jgi:hypothetical protein
VPAPDADPDPELPDPDPEAPDPEPVDEPDPVVPEPEAPDPDPKAPDSDAEAPEPDEPDNEPDPVVADPDPGAPCACAAADPAADVEPVPTPMDLNWESAAFAVSVWVSPEEIATPAAIDTATMVAAPIAATIDQRNLRDPRACPDGSFNIPTFVQHSLRALTR